MGTCSSSDLPYILNTPLGRDALLVERFHGREAVSGLFTFHFDLLSEDAAIGFDDLVGRTATLEVRLFDGGTRYLNGHISRFAQAGRDATFTRYDLELVSWPWFLGRRADCRIFQEMSAPEIVKMIFDEAGFSGQYEDRLSGNYPRRTYCVQYRETSLAFVNRLLEEEGIFFFFEHEDGRHVLVLGDSKSAFRPCAGQEEACYDPVEGGTRSGDTIIGYRFMQRFCSGGHALSDYDFKNPSTSLLVRRQQPSPAGEDAYEIYDYPGCYEKRDPGEGRNEVRLEEQMAPRKTCAGESTCRAFQAGALVHLTGHYRSGMNEEVVLLSVDHTGDQAVEIRGPGGTETEVRYRNTFHCMSSSTSYRPPRKTPKPFVQGPQTAVVVGKAGEEVWVDRWGRIKVQFHWDREGRRDERSSCWIRVSQGWAGTNWGMMFLPRIGQEVIVDFLEGDPDRPIITGRVYNSERMPPYSLPAEQTKSTIQTRSMKGGGADNYNEIRFEDRKGEEEIYLQAEKDWNILVKNDKSSLIKHDKSEKIEHDKSIKVLGKHEEVVHKTLDQTVKDDRSIVVEKNQSMKVILNRTTKIDRSDTLTVADDRTMEVGKNRTTKVGQDDEIEVGKSVTRTVGKSLTLTIGDDRTTEVGKSDTLMVSKDRKATIAGADQVTARDITLTATAKIALVCGGSSITITPAGIILSGPVIKLN